MKKIFMTCLVVLSCIFCINVNAAQYPIGYESDGIITFPEDISTGEGNIIIEPEYADYEFYYQWIELTDGRRDNILAAYGLYNEYWDASTKESAELRKILNDKEYNYQTLLNDENATQEEIDAAYEAYVLANTTFENFKERSANQFDTLYNEYLTYLGKYDDSKWIKSDGLDFSVDSTKYSGEKTYIFWVKIVSGENEVYDYCMVTVEGTLWTDFVEAVKNSGITDSYYEDVLIEGSNNTLSVTIKYEDEDYVVSYKYDNGILSYIPNEDGKYVGNDETISSFLLKALSDIKGYDYEQFVEWFSKQDKTKLTLDEHGIEYILGDYSLESSADLPRLNSFKIDLVNGVKWESSSKDESNTNSIQTTPKDETVDNPKTGIVTYTLAILGGLVVAGGIYYFLRKKNLMKKI